MAYSLQSFNNFVQVENLFQAWLKFRRGKRERPDVVVFERHVENELYLLADQLARGTYVHGAYQQFYVRDPKYRVIHKATVRDRVVHQALYTILYPLFDRRFYYDSYSCRVSKGTHAAITRAVHFMRQESQNFSRDVWVLHGDVDNYFGSIDHRILFTLLDRRIRNIPYQDLCRRIINSFHTHPGRGIPLGNLTSQIFANVYLHELDYFIKQRCRISSYIRYNDDFFLIHPDRQVLQSWAAEIRLFLAKELKLSFPVEKTSISCPSDGVDLLGVVAFPYGLVPRGRWRRAASAVILLAATQPSSDVQHQLTSYLALLRPTRSYLLQERVRLAAGQNNNYQGVY